MDIDGDAAEASKLVRVRFVTKLPPALKVPFASIAIPSNLTRMGLSEIVNMLLQNGMFKFIYSIITWFIMFSCETSSVLCNL